MVKIKNDKGNKDTAIRIKSIQANNLLRKNNGDQDAFLGAGNAMINNSLFAEYMRKHGVTVNTRNFSYDFIIMKFDFGIKGDENIPKMTENELRHYFYENGATVTWESYDKEGNIIEGKTKQIHYKMLMRSTGTVSYTHLDVYKRQFLKCPAASGRHYRRNQNPYNGFCVMEKRRHRWAFHAKSQRVVETAIVLLPDLMRILRKTCPWDFIRKVKRYRYG